MAETGRLSTRSSSALRSGTASSRVRSRRTFQAPLRSDARRKFQPCAVGVMNTDVGAGSMLKLLPGDQYRTGGGSLKHHLHSARGVSCFADTDDAKHRAF